MSIKDNNPANTYERLAKVIARAGVCSRRDAEKLIAEQKVTVNGQLITSPATCVAFTDRIVVEGSPLPCHSPSRLWRYYKPRGIITTHKDPYGRPTLFAALPSDLPRVVSVGRLDVMSEGLILLTNDGMLARRLELPSTRLIRTYRVRVFGTVSEKQLALLQNGLTIQGIHYGPIKAHILIQHKSNCWLKVSLTEGKNRELRKVFAHLGYTVNRLIRERYGPFTLEGLQRGELCEVPSELLHTFLYSLHSSA
jgi:23S rRNA pseudouridine2605 synthase